MKTNKTTGKPAKVKPVSEQLETVKETGQRPEAKEGETETTQTTDQSEVKKDIVPAKSQTAKEKAAEVVDEFTKATKARQEKDAAFIAPYVKAYPGEKAFHVTSDKQVFLERDRGLAVLHQNSLESEEKVQTIKVK